MSDLIERANKFRPDGCEMYCTGNARCPQCMADFAQSERTRIADEIEALSQKTPRYAMVTAVLNYADGLRGKE